MKTYEGMLHPNPKEGRINYYPVICEKEWDELPDLYKVMEWELVKDPHHHGKLKGVTAVIFDVPYMEPYGVRAKVSVHPQEVQKILFCNFEKSDCHLYSICAVELEGGTKLGAKWMQDSISGAFAIVLNNGNYVARQGGYAGYVPEHIQVLPDGHYRYDFWYDAGKTAHYVLGNPFRTLAKSKTAFQETDDVSKLQEKIQQVKDSISLDDKINSASARTGIANDDIPQEKEFSTER